MAEGSWNKTFTALVEHTKAKGSDVNDRVNGLGSNYNMLPTPHDDGKLGFFGPCYIGDATVNGQAVNASQVRDSSIILGIESGTANAYVVTMSVPAESYNAGTRISFVATNTNTGASTVNVDGLGIVDIKASSTESLPGNSIYENDIVECVHTGVFFQLVSTTANVASAANSATSAKIYAVGDPTEPVGLSALANRDLAETARGVCDDNVKITNDDVKITNDDVKITNDDVKITNADVISCEEDRILAETAASTAIASSGILYLEDSWIATASQTVFTTSVSYTVGIEQVYLNGRKLVRTVDFTSTTTDITLTVAAEAGDRVEFITGNHADQGGLATVVEGGNTGWRLDGADPANYGDIGDGAVDFSYSNGASTTRGATGNNSFVSGVDTTASGYYSHAEGDGTIAEGRGNHAEGLDTVASGTYAAHAEGRSTIASDSYTHAEGRGTEASGPYAHAEGYNTVASGHASHAQGGDTIALNSFSHASGTYNVGTSPETLVEVGIGTSDIARANAFEIYTDGTLTAPEATIALIEARGVTALVTKDYADQVSTGLELVSEGGHTGWRLAGKASSNYGDIGDQATDLSLNYGASSTLGATGFCSVATGYQTIASGAHSLSGGYQTVASGDSTFCSGYNTKAVNDNSVAIGLWNIGAVGTSIFEIGIGNGDTARANGLEVHTDGKIVMPNLPTTDPVLAGALWNDSGTLKISAG